MSTPTCPGWCIYTAEEHASHIRQNVEPEPQLHKSEALGRFRFWSLDGQAPTATIIRSVHPDDDLTADDLLSIAADAIKAAAWLNEATRVAEEPR